MLPFSSTAILLQFLGFPPVDFGPRESCSLLPSSLSLSHIIALPPPPPPCPHILKHQGLVLGLLRKTPLSLANPSKPQMSQTPMQNYLTPVSQVACNRLVMNQSISSSLLMMLCRDKMVANFKTEESQRRLLIAVIAAHPELKLNFKGTHKFTSVKPYISSQL